MAPERNWEIDEIHRTLTQGRRFMEELLRENERLRYKVLHLEQAQMVPGGGEEGRDSLEEMNLALRERLAAIHASFHALAEENEGFLARFQDMEHQNENLINLYVSGYNLHASIRPESVLASISEILLNLVGADVFVLWLVDQGSGRLELASITDEEGMIGTDTPALSPRVLAEMAGGRSWEGKAMPHPLIAVPLQIEGKTVGVLAIFRLLPQKKEINSLDRDLLGLLAAQSGAALLGSRFFDHLQQELKTL